MRISEKSCDTSNGSLDHKTRVSGKYKTLAFLLLMLFAFIGGLSAQSEYDFPAGDFWALDAGFGMSDILVEGTSFQFIIDPKLWLSPPLMVGSKVGINFSTDKIVTFEGQVYLRWNFLRLGEDPNKKVNIFAQGGLGLMSAYRGTRNPFNEVTMTRGSIMADVAVGVTIPLTERWHIEPQVRGGYPHIVGASITAGYKFPLPQKIISTTTTEYVEIIKTLPPEEIVKRVKIFAVEFILFGPDIGRYNIGIDRDAQQLNELVIEYVAETLREHPNYRVRLEGHANPYTINYSEIDELMILSAMRANVVADLLREKGVNDEQIVIISFGGTRTATSEWDVRNRNRRVELILIEVGIE